MKKSRVIIIVLLTAAIVVLIYCLKINWLVKANISKCDKIVIHEVREGFLKASEEKQYVFHNGEAEFLNIVDYIEKHRFLKKIDQSNSKYSHESGVRSIKIEFFDAQALLFNIVAYEDNVTIVDYQYVLELSDDSARIFNHVHGLLEGL